MTFVNCMKARNQIESLLSHLDGFIITLNECCDDVETGSALWRDLIIINGLAVRCENGIEQVLDDLQSQTMREVFKHREGGETHDE